MKDQPTLRRPRESNSVPSHPKSPNDRLFECRFSPQCIDFSYYASSGRCYLYSSIMSDVFYDNDCNFMMVRFKCFLQAYEVAPMRREKIERSDQSDDVGSQIVSHNVTKYRRTKAIQYVSSCAASPSFVLNHSSALMSLRINANVNNGID